MTAIIQISPDLRLDLIAIAAGQSDPNKRLYRNGNLEVEGVTQSALEAAALAPVVTPQSEYALQAKAALDATDLTAIRCVKAGVSFPSDWKEYVAALRAIVNGGNGPLPARPSYPSGT